MPYTLTSDEYVEIDGVPLATPAWTLGNLFVVWAGPATRGEDRVIPGAAGRLPKPRRVDSRPVSLELVIVGDFDWDGTPVTDFREGLWLNVQHLRENVTDPTGVGDGTRTMILHAPDGSTPSGQIHVETFELGGLGPNGLTATIDITIKAGALAEVGS